MDLFTLIFLAIGLSMDAFAVSICKGLAMPKLSFRHMAIVGAWFGGFQALMPLIGYLLGIQFAKLINNIAPWVAFVLLAIIGANMIRESFSKEDKKETDALGFKTMLIMAIATSIDALAVGITFACVPVKIISGSQFINTLLGVSVIGSTTFLLSMFGVKIGNVFGARYKNKAELAGGIILILLGIKIILEHFNIIKF
ncbi:MAG: manganese efflux pump MntP family protein [Butyrivibrio sp.]